MSGRNLPNKPLVEAIIEVHWALTPRPGNAPGFATDPNFKLLLGRFFERATGDYPHYEQLPSAVMPDELAADTVQHRFRSVENGWPLVQLGPGVLTLNETAGYDWEPFRSRAERAVGALFEAYPQRSGPPVDRLMLRYLDAIEFNYREQDVLAFIASNLKLQVAIPPDVLDLDRMDPRPHAFVWQASLRCGDPAGLLTLKIATAEAENRPVVVLDTLFETRGDHLPAMPGGFRAWADGAHTLANDLFFKLIEGDLEQQFRGQNVSV